MSQQASLESEKAEIRGKVTLTQFILQSQRKFPEATGQLTQLLAAIQTACKFIASKCRSAGLLQLYGEEGSTNVQGETVKKLDVLSNEAFITALRRSNVVAAMVSEEDDQVIFEHDSLGRYIVCFDPLDGSSNIDVNISIGTIYAIYKADKPAAELTEADLKRPGNELIASGYCMYGSSTVMVLTTMSDRIVTGFTLDPNTGEFVVAHPSIRIPKRKAIYSMNQGNYSKWSPQVRKYVDEVCNPPPSKGSAYSMRYVGSMVADVHRTLHYGGIFAYPADTKSKNGKLRLLYEANPMSLLVENAGGRSIAAKGKRVLDIVPSDIHERSPIFIGSADMIDELETYLE